MKKLYTPFKPSSVVVIGCGGIGMQVILNLARYMANAEVYSTTTLWLVDGDSFENANQSRQFYTRPGNKAQSTATLLRKLFPNLIVEVIPYYVASSVDIKDETTDVIEVGNILEEDNYIFSCVDNHRSRFIISQCAQTLENVLVIHGGNDLVDGSSVTHLRMNGKDILPPIEHYDPAISNVLDDAPFMPNCLAAVAGENGQMLFANMFAATLMLGSFYAFTEGRLRTGPIYFDLLAKQEGLVGPAARLSR